MKKEKRPINVGDKIEWCEGPGRYGPHAVTEIFTDVHGSTVYEADDGSEINRKQVTKVIRKKKKREPRRCVFMVEASDSVGLHKSLHFSEAQAKDFMERERKGMSYRCVKFIEVMNDENN